MPVTFVALFCVCCVFPLMALAIGDIIWDDFIMPFPKWLKDKREFAKNQSPSKRARISFGVGLAGVLFGIGAAIDGEPAAVILIVLCAIELRNCIKMRTEFELDSTEYPQKTNIVALILNVIGIGINVVGVSWGLMQL